jgi:transketolase
VTTVTMNAQDLRQVAQTLRESVVEMLARAGSGHTAGPLGMADILAALYFRCLRHDPQRPEWADRDLFLLSNGHTAPILYAALAHSGYFPVAELGTLRTFGSRLQGHPERLSLPGVESTSGPLGEGLSQGAGYAYVLKYLDRNPHRFVFVAMGDGELDEGNIWEAAMFAAKYHLGQLIGIVDRNYIQIEVNGHNPDAIVDAVETAKAVVDRPTVIIAHTIPGKGVDYMEYDFTWHGKPPTPDQAKEWLEGASNPAAGFDYKAAEKENR